MVNGYLYKLPSLADKLALTIRANSIINAMMAKAPNPPPIYNRAEGSPTLI